MCPVSELIFKSHSIANYFAFFILLKILFEGLFLYKKRGELEPMERLALLTFCLDMKIPAVWCDSNSIKEKEEQERGSCVESREQTLKFRQLEKYVGR